MEHGTWNMEHGTNQAGLEALVGRIGTSPAKAATPISVPLKLKYLLLPRQIQHRILYQRIHRGHDHQGQ